MLDQNRSSSHVGSKLLPPVWFSAFFVCCDAGLLPPSKPLLSHAVMTLQTLSVLAAAAAARSKLKLGICPCRCLRLANLTAAEIHFCVSSCELRVASPAHARAFVPARGSQVCPASATWARTTTASNLSDRHAPVHNGCGITHAPNCVTGEQPCKGIKGTVNKLPLPPTTAWPASTTDDLPQATMAKLTAHVSARCKALGFSRPVHIGQHMPVPFETQDSLQPVT